MIFLLKWKSSIIYKIKKDIEFNLYYHKMKVKFHISFNVSCARLISHM